MRRHCVVLSMYIASVRSNVACDRHVPFQGSRSAPSHKLEARVATAIKVGTYEPKCRHISLVCRPLSNGQCSAYDMTSLAERYPVGCPFCTIAKAYPPGRQPVPAAPDRDLVSPQCYLVLSTEHVLAFLDIMPISPGHILLITRRHYEKMSSLLQDCQDDAEAQEAQIVAKTMGGYIPLLSKALCAATGVEDWNIVQNNGARAAQVVPHVHFHLIPRYQEGRLEREGRLGKVDVGALKSWKMFGRGQREDLDEEEGLAMAEHIRSELRKVMNEVEQRKASKKDLKL